MNALTRAGGSALVPQAPASRPARAADVPATDFAALLGGTLDGGPRAAVRPAASAGGALDGLRDARADDAGGADDARGDAGQRIRSSAAAASRPAAGLSASDHESPVVADARTADGTAAQRPVTAAADTGTEGDAGARGSVAPTGAAALPPPAGLLVAPAVLVPTPAAGIAGAPASAVAAVGAAVAAAVPAGPVVADPATSTTGPVPVAGALLLPVVAPEMVPANADVAGSAADTTEPATPTLSDRATRGGAGATTAAPGGARPGDAGVPDGRDGRQQPAAGVALAPGTVAVAPPPAVDAGSAGAPTASVGGPAAAPAPVTTPAAAESPVPAATASGVTPLPPAPAGPAASAVGPTPDAGTAGRVVPTVSVALNVLVTRGASTARLHLRPEALGGVDVHLRHTAQGLDVRLSADGAEAARALALAAEGLRRQLESQGVTVLRLEIADATTADARGGGDAADRDGAPAADGRSGRPAGARVDVADPTDLTPITPRTTLTLPDGALVDVLA